MSPDSNAFFFNLITQYPKNNKLINIKGETAKLSIDSVGDVLGGT